MKGLDPVVRDGKWELDLRKQGFGWHYHLGPASLSREQAIHVAYAKLEELRAARLAEPHAQLELVTGAPPTFAGVVDRWQACKRVEVAASESYIRKNANRLRRDLGAYVLSDFCDGHGADRVTAYRDWLLAAPLSPLTVRNVFSVLGQVLEFASDPERRWLPFVPRFPKMPKKTPPRFDWIDEADFRRVRARVYADVSPAQLAANLRREGITTDPALYIAQRKVYLSWAMYTGSRKHDCDELVGDDVGLGAGIFVRHARKTGAMEEQFPMPEPLLEDLREYLTFVGREHFRAGERIGGGVWSTATRTMGEIARELELGLLTMRILRRSFVRKMRLLGYSEAECAAYMGHADLTMIRQVYARVVRPVGVARSLWRSPVTAAPGAGVRTRKVLAFPSAQLLKKG